jgi:hypothetical protein
MISAPPGNNKKRIAEQDLKIGTEYRERGQGKDEKPHFLEAVFR